MSITVVDEPKDRPEWIRETIRLVAERMRAERETLLERVARVDDATLARGSDAEWGIGQVATHLLIVERGVLSIALRLARGEGVASGTGQPRVAANAVTRTGIAALAQKAERDLVAFARDFPAEPNAVVTARHPFYGPLNSFGWILTLPNHYDAHLQALDRGTRSAL